MGFITDLLAPTPRSNYAPDDDFWYKPFPDTQTQAGIYVGRDTGLYVSAIFQAIRLISESLAKVPLHIFRRGDDGESRERVRDHNIALTLGQSPNRYLKSLQFRTLAQSQILSRGNHYSQIIPSSRGIEAFNPLSPDAMEVKKLPRRFPNEPRRIGYIYNDPETGTPVPLAQDEVFHLRGPMLSTNDTVGVSAIQYARETIGSAITEQNYSNTLFRQGAMHRGVYSVPGTLTKEQHSQMVEMVKRETSGPSSWGGTLLLSNGATWTSTGMTASDAEFILSRKFTVLEVARWFNIQPHLLFDLDRATFSNIEHQSLEFLQNTMLPHFVNWEQTIDVDLIQNSGFFSEFLLDAIVRADLKSRYDAYGVAIEKGFATPNEVRQKENWNAIEGLDRARMSLNVAMIDEKGEVIPNQKPAPTPAGVPARGNNGNGNQPPQEDRQAYYDRLLNALATRVNGLEVNSLERIFTQCEGETKQKDEGMRFYDQFASKLSKFLCVNQITADAYAANQSRRFLSAVETGAQDEIVADLKKRGQERLLALVLEDGLAEENGKAHGAD